MKMNRSGNWSLLLLCAFGTLSCGPQINPAAKADVDRQVLSLTHKKNAYPKLELFVPRPLAVGQWTQMKMVDEKGQASIHTYKITGESGGAFWFEVVNESYFGKSVTKILLLFGDRKNPNTMEIRQVVTKDKDGQVNVLEGPMLTLMKSMWSDTVNLLSITWEGQQQEDVTVLSGKFAGCYKVRSDANFGPFHSASMTWSHPAVPINGLVKSVSLNRPSTLELIAFGDKGAKSEIP